MNAVNTKAMIRFDLGRSRSFLPPYVIRNLCKHVSWFFIAINCFETFGLLIYFIINKSSRLGMRQIPIHLCLRHQQRDHKLRIYKMHFKGYVILLSMLHQKVNDIVRFLLQKYKPLFNTRK